MTNFNHVTTKAWLSHLYYSIYMYTRASRECEEILRTTRT